MSQWVCEWASEWVRKWVFYVSQTAHAMSRRSFGQSLDPFCFFAFRFSFFHFSLFVFRFSLFVFRFSITGLCHVVTVICVHEWVSVWVSECVRKWVNECFTSIKQLMAYADVHLVKVKILFVFRFSLFVFRFSLFVFRFSFFAFRFSIIGLCHVVTVICVHEYVSVWVSEWVERRKAKSEKQTNFWKTKSEKRTAN